VREGGLEPPRSCLHKVLSLARLPFRHSRGPAKDENYSGARGNSSKGRPILLPRGGFENLKSSAGFDHYRGA
jgi:hypothetical protein